MIGCIPWPTTSKKRGRPYVYSPTVILRCFIVRLWFRVDSNNGLHTFLDMDCQYTHKLALACGLIKIPSSRRTFDRRLKTISIDIKQRISTMGRLFVIEGLIDALLHDSIFSKCICLISASYFMNCLSYNKSLVKRGEILLGFDIINN